MINGWDFSPGDPESSVEGDIEVYWPTLLTHFSKPAETVYFADMEDGPGAPFVITLDNSFSVINMDVWQPSQFPSAPIAMPDSGQWSRRVPPHRHGHGHNAIYVGGHAGFVSGNLTEEEYIEMWMNR